MTRSQLEKKIKYLRKEIEYYCKVFPKSKNLSSLKSKYRHYLKVIKLK